MDIGSFTVWSIS